jgi:hypothetical protein
MKTIPLRIFLIDKIKDVNLKENLRVRDYERQQKLQDCCFELERDFSETKIINGHKDETKEI